MSDGYKGIAYLGEDGKPDPTKTFLCWEDWVEWHDKHAHDEMLQVIGKGVAMLFDKRIEPYKARIAELEAKVEELQKGGLRFCGVHQRAMTYKRGDTVTYDGSMFTAVRDVGMGEEPLKSSGWQLSVKRGRDGREGRAA